MEATVVGVMTSTTVAFGLVLWYVLTYPELLLAMFDDEEAGQTGFFDQSGSVAVTALGWTLGVTVFLLSFATGMATAFLGTTTYY